MDLSKRLQTIISLVEPGEMIADIGTDHGYVPIALVRRGICRKGLAMDVGNGPLERAREHIHAHSMENVIETRLSDGLHMLQPGEADRIVIAGMGGPLMQRILEEGEAAARAAGRHCFCNRNWRHVFDGGRSVPLGTGFHAFLVDVKC